MNPLHSSQRLLLSTLSAFVLLAALPARADLPHETFYLTREEISDEALRGVIGIASIHVMVEPGKRPAGKLPLFTLSRGDFEPDGALALAELRAISGWDWAFESLRKVPVLERQGEHLRVVIDARTNEQAWIRQAEVSPQGPGVEFLSFDDPDWEWSGVELFFLAPEGRTRLYGAARPSARSYPLSVDFPARKHGQPVYDLRILRVHGDFIQLGELINLEEPLDPVGWVPLVDETGLLLVWPVYAPMC